jgi:DNA polymerase III subunit beta
MPIFQPIRWWRHIRGVNQLLDEIGWTPQSEATLPARLLSQMLSAARSVAPGSGSTAGRKGFLLQIQDQRSTVVATDGARLVCVETPEPTPGVTGECRCVVRWKLAEGLQQLASAAEPRAYATITRLNSAVKFQMDDRGLDGGRVSDLFPDYERVLQLDRPLTAKLDPRSLQAAIERATSNHDGSALMRIRADVDRITLSWPVNEVEETVAADYQGPRIEMNFNSEFLLDAVRLFDSHEIALRFGHSASHDIEITSVEAVHELHQRCIVMPMKV